MKPKTREQNFLAKIAGDANADNTMMPRTAEEYFLNQIAENGGSGSSLPSYSSSDIGKVLTVGEKTEYHSEVFIPEQSVTFDEFRMAELSGTTLAAWDFADRQPIKLTVNGKTSTPAYSSKDDAFVLNGTTYLMFDRASGKWSLVGKAGITTVVSAIVRIAQTETAAEWATGGSGSVKDNIIVPTPGYATVSTNSYSLTGNESKAQTITGLGRPSGFETENVIGVFVKSDNTNVFPVLSNYTFYSNAFMPTVYVINATAETQNYTLTFTVLYRGHTTLSLKKSGGGGESAS